MLNCKNCGGRLTESGISKRANERLLTCDNCGEKWQARVSFGFTKLYQVKRPTGDPKEVHSVRVRKSKLHKFPNGVQAAVDEIAEEEK